MMGFIKFKLSKQSSFFFFIFMAICVLLTVLICLVFRCGFNVKVRDPDLYFQKIHYTLGKKQIIRSKSTTTVRRRMLGGPGSSPPRCAWKCGRCTPCRPVHVAVPPGTPVTAEYYPEAWRCKCGNRLYMP